MHRFTVGTAVLAVASCLGAPARAQETEPVAETAPEVVSDAITVTATRDRERSIYELPVSVSVLTEEEVETSPATTPEELLRDVAGVQLQLGNSSSGFPALPSVSIRGLGLGDNGTRTLVLLDGLPMNGAFFGNVFWNRVPKQDVERVEVVRGASSSLFGSYAMGGVVHLITRRVPDAGRVSLDARAGTDETYQGNAFGSARGDRAGFSLNANWLETGGYLEVAPGQRGPIDAENASENASLQARVEADLGARTTALLRGNWFDQDQDRDTVLSHTETRVWDAAAGVETLLDPRNALHFDLYYLDERFATDNISTIPFDSRDAEFVSNAHVTPSEDRGGSARWTRSTDSALASFSLGVDYRAVEGFDDAEIFLADGSLFQTKVGSGEQESIGLYAEASIAPADDLELLASLRHDSFDNRNGRDVTDGVVTRFPDKEFDDLNPRLAVRWQATAEVALRGAVYTGFRAPTLAELYRAFGTSSFQGLPNSQLDPETLAGAELGLDVAVGSFFGQVNAFHNEVEDFIGGVAVAFDPIFTLQNFNIGQIETEGVELIGELRLAGGWSVGGSYTYTDAVITENIDDPSVVGNRVEGAPETTAALRVGYARPEGLAATVRGRYVDEQFQDSTNTARLPAHTVVDLYLAHPLGRRAEVYATAENLFDEEYLAGAFGGLESLGAPRQISGGVRLRLD